MTRRRMLGVVLSVCCLSAAAAYGEGQGSPALQKPVKVSRECFSPKVPGTWTELVAQSDLVVEFTVQASAGGEAEYYGAFTSVVTANTVTITRVVYLAESARAERGRQILVLTPGGRVDRGEYIEHVISEHSEPWSPGESYLVALKWESRLGAWRPTAQYESVFRILPDDALRSSGYGPIARAGSRLGHAETLSRVGEAVAYRTNAVSTTPP